jgi:hypothetical protein
MKNFLLVLISLLFFHKTIQAQCSAGQKEVVIQITPDNYPQEISWNLKDLSGNIIASGGSVGDTLCVNASTCLTFTILDSFGDGICCSYGNGSYSVRLDGQLIVSGGSYTTSQTTSFNCPQGVVCNNPIVVDTGIYTAPTRNYWYSFTPTVSGVYDFSTCFPENNCDTKLWVYPNCMGVRNDSSSATLFYNNNNSICNQKAFIRAPLTAGTNYILRVGDASQNCSGAIKWEIQYHAACLDNQKQIIVSITPDNYPQETTWDLKDNTGATILSGGSTGGSICVDSTKCITFTIRDSYGDGICCNYGQGSYSVTYDGQLVASGGNFTTSETTNFNCPPGSSCNLALNVDTGFYVAPSRDFWYRFTPSVSGMYSISTCNPANTCDTKLWVYANCNGNINNTNAGTLYYDDNSGGCGQKAVISAALSAGSTYLVRVGDVNFSCTDSIQFSINYMGAVVGCMDPSACNYNPMATDSGACYYAPHPNCLGPDLIVNQQSIINSLNIGNTTATNCEVVEGCLTGYGNRTILRFDTRIENIGQQDYYIGNPQNNPNQFNFINCHGHAHYEGYADYILYDSDGNALPIGRKNGFCVMDLQCPAGIPAQYGCSNMGITAGCADIYGSGLGCQWIDITDVDTGNYTLAVKVNWDQSPDALGHYETNYINNWAQVCIHISQDANGFKSFTQLVNCPAYIDCAGTPYGNATVDCRGICGGGRKKGDLDSNSVHQTNDAQLYNSQNLSSSISPTNCNDLNASGNISVWDAALINQCARHGSNNNTLCNFPRGTNNPNEVAILSVETLDVVNQFVDISITNPNNEILAYEFTMSGIQILNVENKIPINDYPITPEFTVGGNKVIGISYVDSSINRKYVPTKLCRIHYSALTDSVICISNIIDIVNKNVESVNKVIGDSCINVPTAIGIKKAQSENNFVLTPNPADNKIIIKPYFKYAKELTVSIVDLLGRELLKTTIKNTFEEQEISVQHIPVGLYTVTIISDNGSVSKKIAIKR